jgi:hypothetical protein
MLPGILLLGHGFDNMAGLNVRNRLGEEWIAYGDQCAFANKENDFFSGNDENRKRHNMVLQASAQEVVDAYVTNNPKTVSSTVWNNVPDWELAQHLNASFTMGNAAPAIRAKRGTATPLWELRKDVQTLDGAWEWDFEDIGNTEDARKWSRTATVGGAALSGALYCGSHTLALAKKKRKQTEAAKAPNVVTLQDLFIALTITFGAISVCLLLCTLKQRKEIANLTARGAVPASFVEGELQLNKAKATKI